VLEQERKTMIDFFAVATQSFQQNLSLIENEGRKDSPEWHLANGLLRLAQGLKADREAEEDLRKGLGRSWVPPK
jgi:hypothetical protein